MTSYQYALGHNQALTTSVRYQPRCEGVFYALERIGADSLASDDGNLVSEFIYDYLSPEEYENLLSDFGLDSAKTAQITLNLPNQTRTTFAAYNCVIQRPRKPSFDFQNYRNVRFFILIESEVV